MVGTTKGEAKASRQFQSQTPMHLIHVTDEHARSAGGTTAVITANARHMTELGHQVTIVCTEHDGHQPPAGVRLVCVGVRGIRLPWRWSPKLSGTLASLIRERSDCILHVHGTWLAPQWVAARSAKRANLPFVLTDHGMLAPWFWGYKGRLQRYKKLAYWHGIAYPAFKHAAVVHAITPPHEKTLFNMFPNRRISVIPNAIGVRAIDDDLQRLPPGSRWRRQICFVGRLDPQKGIDLLLRAFAAAQLHGDWDLLIAGPERAPGYRTSLEDLAWHLGIHDRVQFLGPVTGLKKWELYRDSWVAAVPSRFEAIGLVNLEAAACRTPSITTWNTGLEDWEEGGGLLVRPIVEELAESLRTATSWTEEERFERGQASRSLVQRSYSWQAVREQWADLYASLPNGARLRN